MNYLIYLSLVCAPTIKINKTKHPWNEHDNKTMKRSTKVCSTDERYIDFPCLKKFIKVGKQDYHAICGSSRN